MATVSPTTLYNEGCGAGSSGISGLVVLDFGQPWAVNGQQGTADFASGNPFGSIAQITTAAENYLAGFYNCSPSSSRLVLAVGTSNYGGAGGTGGTGFVNYAHGNAWGQMVASLEAWVGSQGYGAQESVAGGNDIEPSWGPYSQTQNWLNGYDAATTLFVYDYGSADGCPQSSASNGGCNNGWNQAAVAYAAWGASDALPLPENYCASGSQANQWYEISLYSAQTSYGKLKFQGTMTGANGCAPSASNSDSGGFLQLQNLINSNTTTAYPMKYSTDITHAN